jgi:hypothetical protein
MTFPTIGNRSTILIAALTLIFAQTAFAQSHDEAADMAAYMAAATPGTHHKAMAAKAGSWKTSNKLWMAPGQPPMETVGTSEIIAVLDGRFVQEVTKAEMMGGPWEGRGTFGYDNSSKKHIGNWLDSFGTAMMSLEGTCDGTCKTITMSGEYFDPATKTTKAMKTVTTKISDDEALLTMYDIAKDGSEIKMGEVRYERTTAQAKR